MTDAREALWRARFVAQGAGAAGLATVVSTMVAAAGEVLVLLATGDGPTPGLAWQAAGIGLPAAALLAVLFGQARLARHQADLATYRLFVGGAGLVLALFPAGLAYLLASGTRVDAPTWVALAGLPLAGAALLWRARTAAGPGDGWRPWLA